jgi:hypothetical protein
MNTCGMFGESWGRLGNQLFQIGLLFGLRHRHGRPFYLARQGESVWDCFDLEVAGSGPPCPHRYDEVHGSCNFDPHVFDQPDGTAFYGYFQSYRYFQECRPELVGFLRFRHEYRACAAATLYAYRRRHRRPLVAVHVRRGDYLQPDAEDLWGNLARDGYYQRAAAAVGDGVTYLVFSDDVPWCRAHLGLEPAEFVDLDPYTSLCMMTGCDVNVVANSSFSWWGAFLNTNKAVYAPMKWWRNLPPPNDLQADIVPPGWTAISTFSQLQEVRAP